MAQYFYDKQIRRYIQQFIRLFAGFNVQMGKNEDGLPIYQQVPVRYGDINRMAAHITRENSENVVNSVPFISCYVTALNMMPERRTYQDYTEKMQVYEKKFDQETGQYVNEVGNRYTIERHAPVPYMLQMNCDVWTSNTDQKLQLLEQILVLFNPTLDIRTSSNIADWSALSHVEMTSTNWSSRSVGSSIDDIIDVSTISFDIPVYINPPAKVQQQKLIYTIINELYNLDNDDFSAFDDQLPFDRTTLEYTIVTYEDKKARFENNKLFLLNKDGTDLDENGNKLSWKDELTPFGELRERISQLRLRKGTDPSDKSNDIIGRLEFDPNDNNALIVDVDNTTLPSNTLTAVNAVLDPQRNYPGDGTVPNPAIAQRYILLNDIPDSAAWSNTSGKKYDIVEYDGVQWTIVFDSSNINTTEYVTNIATQDQLEWNGKEWLNSNEGIYNAGYWRLYL